MKREILKALNERPIAYYPIYRKITGSTTAGILLSQIMYWFAKQDKFYKTDAAIMEETMLTKKELEGAKRAIKKLPFLTITREGLPAKTYYAIDWDLFEKTLLEFEEKTASSEETVLPERDKAVSPKGGNTTPPIGETYIDKSFDIDYTETKTNAASYDAAFEKLWKTYTLGFLKKQGRRGGNKSKAYGKFKKLLTKGHSLSEIEKVVAAEMRLKIGHRDLERVLTEESVIGYQESKQSSTSSKNYTVAM